MTHRTRAASAGFTLLEILIAFTIAATALGLLFRIHGNSTATVILSEEYQKATSLAQALVAEFAVTERTLAFIKNGSTGPYDWSVRADEHTSATADAPSPQPPYRLRSMVVEVSWVGRDRDRRILINTIRPFFGPDP